MTTRVVLVDDHPVVRAGMRALLASTGKIDVVGEAATGADAQREVALTDPDVVLMDLQLGTSRPPRRCCAPSRRAAY